jgi:uncharacterized protein (DUF486 family)
LRFLFHSAPLLCPLLRMFSSLFVSFAKLAFLYHLNVRVLLDFAILQFAIHIYRCRKVCAGRNGCRRLWAQNKSLKQRVLLQAFYRVLKVYIVKEVSCVPVCRFPLLPLPCAGCHRCPY